MGLAGRGWPVAEHLTLKESKEKSKEREGERTHSLPSGFLLRSPGQVPWPLPRLPSCGDWQPALQRTTRTGNAAGPQLGAGKLAHRRLRDWRKFVLDVGPSWGRGGRGWSRE